MEIIKSAGTREKFNKDKLCGSLEKAGAPADLARKVCNLTGEKYFSRRKHGKNFSDRPWLSCERRFESGGQLRPAPGHRRTRPGRIFVWTICGNYFAWRMDTKQNAMLWWRALVLNTRWMCPPKDGAHYIVEAKYRNEPGIKTHIDVVMYGDARMADIARLEESAGGKRT